MSNQENMSPTDVAKDLRPSGADTPSTPKQDKATTAATHAKVLSRPDNTVHQAQVAAQAQNQATAAAADASLQAAAQEAQATQRVLRNRPQRSSQERAVDTVKRYLAMFENAAVGSKDKVEALQKIIAAVVRTPKATVLNEILAFFKAHKDDEWMGPMQALQSTEMLDKTTSIRVRTLYTFMTDLAAGTASNKTIQKEMIRTIFESDDLVNWISVKMANSGRR